MCKYNVICPACNEYDHRCSENEEPKFERCVPLLLEAYHDVKGTDYGEIRKYLP